MFGGAVQTPGVSNGSSGGHCAVVFGSCDRRMAPRCPPSRLVARCLQRAQMASPEGCSSPASWPHPALRLPRAYCTYGIGGEGDSSSPSLLAAAVGSTVDTAPSEPAAFACCCSVPAAARRSSWVRQAAPALLASPPAATEAEVEASGAHRALACTASICEPARSRPSTPPQEPVAGAAAAAAAPAWPDCRPRNGPSVSEPAPSQRLVGAEGTSSLAAGRPGRFAAADRGCTSSRRAGERAPTTALTWLGCGHPLARARVADEPVGVVGRLSACATRCRRAAACACAAAA
jgi:hypothetical protein